MSCILIVLYMFVFSIADDINTVLNEHRAAYEKSLPIIELPMLTTGERIDFEATGVIYQNGVRYTYYSSNVLPHYQMDEWIVGKDRTYRDKEGYIVVAAQMPKGSMLNTPFGKGKVYDYCETDNTVDIYVKY